MRKMRLEFKYSEDYETEFEDLEDDYSNVRNESELLIQFLSLLMILNDIFMRIRELCVY